MRLLLLFIPLTLALPANRTRVRARNGAPIGAPALDRAPQSTTVPSPIKSAEPTTLAAPSTTPRSPIRRFARRKNVTAIDCPLCYDACTDSCCGDQEQSNCDCSYSPSSVPSLDSLITSKKGASFYLTVNGPSPYGRRLKRQCGCCRGCCGGGGGCGCCGGGGGGGGCCCCGGGGGGGGCGCCGCCCGCCMPCVDMQPRPCMCCPQRPCRRGCCCCCNRCCPYCNFCCNGMRNANGRKKRSIAKRKMLSASQQTIVRTKRQPKREVRQPSCPMCPCAWCAANPHSYPPSPLDIASQIYPPPQQQSNSQYPPPNQSSYKSPPIDSYPPQQQKSIDTYPQNPQNYPLIQSNSQSYNSPQSNLHQYQYQQPESKSYDQQPQSPNQNPPPSRPRFHSHPNPSIPPNSNQSPNTNPNPLPVQSEQGPPAHPRFGAHPMPPNQGFNPMSRMVQGGPVRGSGPFAKALQMVSPFPWLRNWLSDQVRMRHRILGYSTK